MANKFRLGWLTVIGWQAALATANYISASLISGLLVLTPKGYEAHPWHITLLFWAVMAFAVLINAVVSPLLSKFEGLIFVLHLLGFFAIMLPLVVLGERQDASQVFATFFNLGGLPTQGLSFMVGLIGPVFMFLGKFKLSMLGPYNIPYVLSTNQFSYCRCRWGGSCKSLWRF